MLKFHVVVLQRDLYNVGSTSRLFILTFSILGFEHFSQCSIVEPLKKCLAWSDGRSFRDAFLDSRVKTKAVVVASCRYVVL